MVVVTLGNGERHEHFVTQSLGNVHRPLSDRQLDQKFRDQAILVLPETQVDALLEQCWRMDSLKSLEPVLEAAVP